MSDVNIKKVTDLIYDFDILDENLIKILKEHEIELLSYVYKLGRDHGQHSIMNNPLEYIKKHFYEL